jgi:hypothetical protein
MWENVMKNAMPFVVAAVAVMLGAALLQGNWSERWGDYPELKTFGERMQKVPMDIGDWHGERQADLDERTMNAAGAVASLNCRFTHRITNQWVDVNIVCGRMVDVFAHTPDRCYPAVGFSTKDDPVKQTVDYGVKGGTKAEFWTASYYKSDQREPQTIRIFWDWSVDGIWETPDTPKLKYAGQHAVFKLYLHNLEMSRSVAENPSVDFAKVLLPELTKAFFPNSEAEKEAAEKLQQDIQSPPTPTTGTDEEDK